VLSLEQTHKKLGEDLDSANERLDFETKQGRAKEAQLEELKAAIDEERASKECALKSKRQVELDIKSLHGQLEDAEEHANNIEVAKHKIEIKLEDIKKEADSASGSKAMDVEACSALEKELDKWKQLYEEERKTCSEFECAKKHLEGEYEDVTVGLANETQAKTALEQTKRKVECDYCTTKTALDSALVAKTEQENLAIKLKEELDEAKVTDLQDVVETETKARTRLNCERCDLQARVDEATQITEEAEEVKTSLEEAKACVQADLDNARKELDKERKAKDDLEDQKLKLTREANEPHECLEETLASTSTLEKRKKSLEGELKEMNKTLEGEIKTCGALNKKFQALERTAADAAKRVKELEAGAGSAKTISKLEADLRKVCQQLDDSTAEITSITEGKKRAEAESFTVKEELEALCVQHEGLKVKFSTLVDLISKK
jgi:chromosome segregation ATPase